MLPAIPQILPPLSDSFPQAFLQPWRLPAYTPKLVSHMTNIKGIVEAILGSIDGFLIPVSRSRVSNKNRQFKKAGDGFDG
jgi:hypothetical protein